jgi:uncharacterized membrane protein
MGHLLRAGVVLAAIVVSVGGVLYLAHHGETAVDLRVFHGEPTDLRQPVGVVHDAVAFESRGIIQLGAMLLIGTPIARVLFSVYAFGRQRDWLFVAITLIVLCILMVSLFGVA